MLIILPSVSCGDGWRRASSRRRRRRSIVVEVLISVGGDLVEPGLDHGDPRGELMADGDLGGAAGEQLEALGPDGQALLEVDAEHELVEHIFNLQRHLPRLLHPHVHVGVATAAPPLVGVLDEGLQPLELVFEQHHVAAHLLEHAGLFHGELRQPPHHEAHRRISHCFDLFASILVGQGVCIDCTL